MASSTVVLTWSPGSSDEVEIEINGPTGPTEIDDQPQWVTSQTADGTRVAYRGTSQHISHWTLQFDSLTTTQRNALAGFFNGTAKGPEQTWQYTHTDDTVWSNARFLDTALRWERMNDSLWGTTVRLELREDVDS